MKQLQKRYRRKTRLLQYLLFAFILSGCQQDSVHSVLDSASTVENIVVEELTLKNSTPTAEMPSCTLVSDGSSDARNDAADILAVKLRWPMAMQSKNVEEFEAILTKDFVFVADGRLINRADYIKDRTAPNDWQITHVVYSNMALQLFGNHAVLSYRNRVTNENKTSSEKEIEIIHWTDVFEKEADQWKIAAAHVIDFKIE